MRLELAREILLCAALLCVCYPRPHSHPLRLIALVIAVAAAICLLIARL